MRELRKENSRLLKYSGGLGSRLWRGAFDGVQMILEHGLGLESDHSVRDLSVFEYQQCGNTVDFETLRERRGLIDVVFEELDFSIQLAGNFVNRWR